MTKLRELYKCNVCGKCCGNSSSGSTSIGVLSTAHGEVGTQNRRYGKRKTCACDRITGTGIMVKWAV
jgi:hypothetical protein